MGYSGETTYSYGTDGEGTHVDSETYHGGSGSTTYSTVYSHGRETQTVHMVAQRRRRMILRAVWKLTVVLDIMENKV